MNKKTIGFIGNFEAPFSTENDRMWSFNKLGHDVIAFQESKVDVETIREHLPKLDMLMYSHTHGWEIKGLIELFKECKKLNIPTVSVHLDRWAWLEREKDVGKEATWFTEFMFMADGSPEGVELYKEAGVKKWFYLKPGVIERDCYMAAPDPVKFPHEIIFVGSKGYHPEYPFRPKLVEFLEKTYGDRFGHYGGDGLGTIRGHDLNVLYASAKIVVGDTCFGDRPKYWSDRVTETIGRGGFLLHPKVLDLPVNIMGNYKAGDLDDVKSKVDIWLKQDQDREKVRKFGFEYVKKFANYTIRAEEILRKVFDES